MAVIAKLNYLRIAPRKVRLVANLIREKKVEEAQAILNFTIKRAAKPLLKLLEAAIANARHNFQLDPSNLYIAKITVDEGPKYKRWMQRARGMASEIQKKTSHVTLVLDEITPTKKKKKTKKAEEKTEEKIKEIPKIEKKPKTERGLQPTLRPLARGGPLKRIFRRKSF